MSSPQRILRRRPDGTYMGRCPLTRREGPYLLMCDLRAGHDGLCLCSTITLLSLAHDSHTTPAATRSNA